MAESVLTEARGAVLVITLNRPRVHNVIDQTITDGVLAALRVLDDDTDLRVGVLTGTSTMFCAGLDLKHFSTHGMPVNLEGQLFRFGSHKPLVAAIEGLAIGGGLELALIADLLVAALDVKLGQAETRYGLFPTGGALLKLPRTLPEALVAEMVFTGAPIDAQTAFDRGLLARLTEPGQALDVAMELALAIAANPPSAVQAAKRVLQARGELTEDALWHLQQQLADEVFVGDDAREGVQAFLERREPRWRGTA